MRWALKRTEQVYRTHGLELVVTCTTCGEHSKWSWHPFGMAVDLRTYYWRLEPGAIALLVLDLKAALPPPYQVVLEKTHIHLECDLDAFQEYAGKHPSG